MKRRGIGRIALVMAAIFVLTICNTIIPVSADNIVQELIYTTEDGYIQTNKNTNETTWINDEHLRVHGSSVAFRVMFMKFEIPEFNGEVENATLKLTSNSVATLPQNDTLTVHMVKDNDWDSVSNHPTYEEERYTPDIDDAVLATFTFSNTDITFGQIIEIDVKDIIKQAGTYSIAIKRNATSGDLRFFSNEGAASDIRKPHINMSVLGTIESKNGPQIPEVEPGEDGWRRRIVEEEQADGSVIRYGWSTPIQSEKVPISEIPKTGS